jgi:hypothetical protein
MSNKLSGVISAFFFAAVLFGCKKNTDVPDNTPAQFQPVTFKFGSDSTTITVDNSVQVIKNMPRSCDATQLAAAVVLPAGYSINPNPSTVQNYTNGITYTVTNSNGKTYTVQVTVLAYNAVSNPYGIYTAKHLSDIRNGLNDSYVLMNDIQLPDLTAANAASSVGISDYSQYGWYSIGSRYVNGGHVIFRGSLDGQNHVIKNFTSAYRPSGNPLPAGIDPGRNGKSTDGLFGNAIGATFKNIGIQLATAGIKDFVAAGESYGFVGSLVGLADSSTITNCYVTGNAGISAGQNTGGLIGAAYNSNINKCYAALTVATGNYAITSGTDAGGLIGTALKSNITDCYASCSVMGSVSVGGFIGNVNTCTIKTCYASGNVVETPYNAFGSLIATNTLGGLIGAVSSISPATTIIENCYALGAVTGANGANTDFHKATRMGGLIGQIGVVSGPVSVTNCYAVGPVTRVWTNASIPYLTGALTGNTPNGVFITSAVCTNYWDKTTTGQTNLGGGNATLAQDNGFTANGKTTAEMKTTATYANWDFSSVWNIGSGTNNGYPYLRTVIK